MTGTSNYHTPIPAGAAANADTINDPLGQIDEALSNALLVQKDGHIIQDEGVDLAQQQRLNFVGSIVTVTNSVGKTIVTFDVSSLLAKTGLTEWDEQGSDPSTPAANKWKLYFKSGGLYLIEDTGTVVGPIDIRNYLAKTGLTEWDEQGSDPSTPAANKWKLYFKAGGLYFIEDTGTVIGPLGAGGGSYNYLINGGFDRFVRADPAVAKTMTDGTYLSPDRWYSLIQGSGATEKKGASIGSSKNSLRLTAGGTTNRYGKAQALKSVDSLPYRGQTGVFQIRIKPTNNAGSGSRNYRAAILAWTGTADAITRDIVNDWTSGNYTTGNFFASTNLTLVGTAAASVAHNTEGVLSISGSVPTNCNNLIVFFWAQDVPTHASDYADFAEAGLYIATTVQSWKPRFETEEIALCLHHCYPISHEPNASAYLYPPYGVRVSTNIIDAMISLMPITMFATPTLVTSSPTFAATTPSGNQIGFFNNDSGAWATITGALTLSISNTSAAGLTFRATAGTSFSGSAGNMGNWYFGADAIIYLEAEL